MKLTFKQFETASILLENTTESISDDILLENGFTREEIEKINEGILGDILGGLFGKIKEKILRAIPGNLLKKVDVVLKEYKEAKFGIYDKTLKERNKIYKTSIEAEENPTDNISKKRAEEIKIRSEKAIEQIEAANKSKIDAINKKLTILIKDKSDIVRNYVDMQLAQIQEDVANKQLKDAEDNASETILDDLENQVKEAKKQKEAAAKAIEEAKVKEKEDAVKKENDPANSEEGQVWTRTNSDNIELEVEILKVEDGYVSEWKVAKDYKNKKGEIIKAGRVFKGAAFPVDQLNKLIKK